MSLSFPKVLTVPGWHGSAPGHWQSIWEAEDSRLARVEQRDWAAPRLTEWLCSLDNAVSAAPGPVVFAAHSLGALTVAQWAERSRQSDKVAAALLVAPPYLGRETPYSPEMQDFFPAIPKPLPFPSVTVISQDDPYISFEAAGRLAEAWQSTVVDAGQAGHINVESGHGRWPEGRALLDSLLATRVSS